MAERLVPMLQVPDVRATADWYANIGFQLAASHVDCGEMLWARLVMGEAEVMLNIEGRASSAFRREVDLYIHTDRLEVLWARIKDRAEVVEPPHETEYGMREFIVRDFNRFWVTFGEPAG